MGDDFLKMLFDQTLSNACYLMVAGGAIYLAYFLWPGRDRKKRRLLLFQKIDRLQENHKKLQVVDADSDYLRQGEKKNSFQADRLSDRWKHDRIDTFYPKYILPHAPQLKDAGYYDPILFLLNLLDENGDCPSGAGETDLKITLFDHSLDLAESMVDTFRAKPIDDRLKIGTGVGNRLVIALGHDIGKIPEFGCLQRFNADPAFISALTVEKAIFRDHLPERAATIDAIRDQHKDLKPGSLAHELQLAHDKARLINQSTGDQDMNDKPFSRAEIAALIQKQIEKEKAMIKGVMTAQTEGQTDLSWLDPAALIYRIEPLINRVDASSRCPAFSLNGIVYVMPATISELVREMAKTSGQKIGTDDKAIQASVKAILDHKGAIPAIEETRANTVGIRIAIIRPTGKKFGLYLPIVASAFSTDVAELEGRKKEAPLIADIIEIVPERKKSQPSNL